MIIADSFGQPRKQDGIELHYSQTWPYLLADFYRRNKSIELAILSEYGLESNKLKSSVKFYKLFDSNLIFMQLGIVDCSRRAMSKSFLQIVKRIPIINNIIKWITKKYHYQLTRLYNITYTSKSVFFHNIEVFIKEFPVSNIYLLPIFPVGKNMISKSYGIEKQIMEYNFQLEKISKKYERVIYLSEIFHSFKDIIEELTFSDGYHLNVKGQNLLFEKIVKNIE